jgi:CBS domain-containing protein
MRALDVMTTDVITVDPNTSVRALATLLSERGISGVPVVDSDNRLIGVVSEGDLLHRVETQTERLPEPVSGRRRSWWLHAIASDQDLARDYVKSHGRTVNDVMTPGVISVTDTTELAEIAMLLETKRIKRVPVVRDGKLVGIVGRANLVRALVATSSEPATDADSDDRTIRQKLLAEMEGQEWVKMQEWFKTWAADVIVRDRVVHFWLSRDQSAEERRALRIAAENIPGVRRVEEHIVPILSLWPIRRAGRPVPRRPSTEVTSLRRQIGGDLADLLSGQVLRVLVHDLVGPRH